LRLAAIDIGSNAVRLLVADVSQQHTANNGNGNELRIKKIKLYRIPVRLGIEAFTIGTISDALISNLVKTMQAFKLIMEVYNVENFRACATSALREANNTEIILERVKKEAGIAIQLIQGQEEAKIILSNRLANILDNRFSHLYVDVGGGSTEISLLQNGNLGLSKSFKIGTLRIHKNQITTKHWQVMGDWLTQHIQPTTPLAIVGSGGNINRVFKRSNNRYGQPLMYPYLRQERDLLAALSIEERIMLQDLNRDRAEVIIPALDIFLFVMEKTAIQQVIVPKIGLADGVVRQLYRELLV